MKARKRTNWNQAFTLFEALIVIAVLLLLALLLPGFVLSHRMAARLSCVNELKQVGLAYRVWSGDNGDKYPMAVSTNLGGSMERALTGDAVLTFQVLSNELSTPKILVCPYDTKRNPVINFTHITRDNLSYFVGVDATETNVTMWLGGDRNLTTGKPMTRGLQNLTTNQAIRWTSEIHKNAGNILLADGSVQQLSSADLSEAIARTGVSTNRLAFP